MDTAQSQNRDASQFYIWQSLLQGTQLKTNSRLGTAAPHRSPQLCPRHYSQIRHKKWNRQTNLTAHWLSLGLGTCSQPVDWEWHVKLLGRTTNGHWELSVVFFLAPVEDTHPSWWYSCILSGCVLPHTAAAEAALGRRSLLFRRIRQPHQGVCSLKKLFCDLYKTG